MSSFLQDNLVISLMLVIFELFSQILSNRDLFYIFTTIYLLPLSNQFIFIREISSANTLPFLISFYHFEFLESFSLLIYQFELHTAS